MTTTTLPKRVSGGDGEHGHLDELTNDPIGLFWRVRKECGDVGMFQLAGNEVVLVSGAAANEEFFRAPDELLDQAAAYPFMTPVFGEGVVFDTSPEERSKALHNQALKGAHMKQHAVTIPNEVERMIANWGDEGEIDLDGIVLHDRDGLERRGIPVCPCGHSDGTRVHAGDFECAGRVLKGPRILEEFGLERVVRAVDEADFERGNGLAAFRVGDASANGAFALQHDLDVRGSGRHACLSAEGVFHVVRVEMIGAFFESRYEKPPVLIGMRGLILRAVRRYPHAGYRFSRRIDDNARDRQPALFAINEPQPAELLARAQFKRCLLYTSPSPRDRTRSRMPSSA